MANATVPHTTTTSRKRKPLSAARVYQAWSADVGQHGRKGAYRRTAELVGCTPEYIRQLVAKHEAVHTLAPALFTTHELDYTPAPGEKPLVRPGPPPTDATKAASHDTADTCVDYVKQDTELNVNTCETGEQTQVATDTQPQVVEREHTVLPLPVVPTGTPQTIAPCKRYAPRPATRPATTRLRLWLATHVNPYMVVALAGVLVLYLAVQMAR